MILELELKNKSLLGLLPDQLAEILAEFKEPAFRALQIYKWLHHHNVDSFEEMTNIPKGLRHVLSEKYRIKTFELSRRESSADGTEKFLWKLWDCKYIESVLIPDGDRNTLCISSQVGCSLGCHFCATGLMGLIRNLTVGEIVEQILQVNALTGKKITNVVFMGMGEPFMNYPRVIQASKIMADPEGMAIAGRRITISTSGIVPRIYDFADQNHPFGLAISLHAPEQTLREQLMPIAKKFPLEELIKVARYYLSKHKRRRITFEYVVLEGVNDSLETATKLIKLLSGLRCKLNIIPYNDTALGYHAPSGERLQTFVSELMKAPFTVTVRKSRGQDIAAACGQLFVEATAETRPRFLEPPLSERFAVQKN